MKQLWSERSGAPILRRHSEAVLGHLSGVFMSPDDGRVIAFLVGMGKVLSPVDIEAWKKNHVQVADSEALIFPTELLRLKKHGIRRSFLNGKRVYSKSGRRMGRVRDFTLDTSTNSVVDFHISKRLLGIERAKRIIGWKDVSEVTDKGLILNVEPEATQKNRRRLEAPAVS